MDADPRLTDLDPAALDRLVQQGGEELRSEILASFLARTPARLRAIEEGLEAGRPGEAARVLHKLGSSAALVGAVGFGARARDLERRAEGGDLERREVLALARAFDALGPHLEAAATPGGSQATDPRPGGPRRVALVEDNDDSRLLARALLADHYALEEYADGPRALEGILARPPDLVLLDISLPGMDGCEVLERLRQAPGLDALPVVALTAHAMVGDREHLLGLGFDGYVSKPIVDRELLLDTLSRLLGGRP